MDDLMKHRLKKLHEEREELIARIEEDIGPRSPSFPTGDLEYAEARGKFAKLPLRMKIEVLKKAYMEGLRRLESED